MNAAKLFSSIVYAMALAGAAVGQLEPMVARVDSYTAASPSGRFKLWVVPSHTDGTGSAFYEMSKDGKVLWTRTLSATLDGATVDDQGLVGGCTARTYSDTAFFEVMLLASNGHILIDDKYRVHQPPTADWTDSVPNGTGVTLDGPHDRMVVSVKVWGRGTEQEWWTYRLSTRRRESVLHPAGQGADEATINELVPLPDTPLFLANWSAWDDGPSSTNARFTLIDSRNKTVWRMNLKGDYDFPPSSDHWKGLASEGAILGLEPHGRFEIRLVKQGKRVTYQAKRSPQGWKVVEIGRTDYLERAPPKEQKPTVADIHAPTVELNLERKWSIPLGPGLPSAFRNAKEFYFLGEGRIAMLSQPDSGRMELIVATLSGAVIHETPVPTIDGSSSVRWRLVQAGDTHLYLICSFESPKIGFEAWFFDSTTGNITLLKRFKEFDIAEAAGFKDGSFAALSHTVVGNMGHVQLRMFDKDGNQLWILADAGLSKSGIPLQSNFEHLAVDSMQRLVIVSDHTVHWFNEFGNHLGGFKVIVPEWATFWDLSPLPNGGLCAESGNRFWIFSDKNPAPKELKPILRNGKALESATAIGLRADSTGQLWVSCEEAIFPMDREGVLGVPLGTSSQKQGPTSIAEIYVDPSGGTTLCDQLTGNVYCFSPDGKLAHVCNPLATDYPKWPAAVFPLLATRSGDVYMAGPGEYPGFGSSTTFLHFDPAGRRIGMQKIHIAANPLAIKEVPPTWRWHGPNLLDDHGRVRQIVNRWPDKSWTWDSDFSVAPNGKLMLVGKSRWSNYDCIDPDRIAFYSASGEPERQSPLPAGLGRVGLNAQAYDGTAAYIAKTDQIMAFDKSGKPLWRFKPPTHIEEIFPSRDGLAIWDGRATILWYSTKIQKGASK